MAHFWGLGVNDTDWNERVFLLIRNYKSEVSDVEVGDSDEAPDYLLKALVKVIGFDWFITNF